MQKNEHRDTLYAEPRPSVGDFAFDERVVPVFSDMIRRSVPGYHEVIAMSGRLARRYAPPHTHVYDLGCSLGDTTFSMARALAGWEGRIWAVDNAPAMAASCRANVERAGLSARVTVVCEDIRAVEICDASFVTLNYTLQFIPPAERLALLQRIYRGMKAGSALFVSEKIAFEDEKEQALQTELHHAFKRANGYSELEISQKRTALEKVMIPDTFLGHVARFEEAGFRSTTRVFQNLNFASMLVLR